MHKTISSLLLDSWRHEMNQEIDRINQALPNTPDDEKADAIHECIGSVILRIDRCKAEHNRLLKDDMAMLELSLWEAKLDEIGFIQREGVRTRGQRKRSRNERRITSGADTVIKNVLPFLKLA
jgi:hypothetical protein